MRAVLSLWEESWEPDAILLAPNEGFANPDRVRAVRHQGANLRMEAVHLRAPSPQRTPVLFQAGSSPDGQRFAGRYAECVFVSGPSAAVLAPRVARLRDSVSSAGRDGARVRVFALATIVLGRTDAEAADRLADYRSFVDPKGALVLMSGWISVDFAATRLDEKVRFVENDAGHAAMENFTRADSARDWTVHEVASHVGIGGAGPVFCGSPATVAEALARFRHETGIDGFNLSDAVLPESFEHIVDWLVPEMQSRGLYRTAYAPGTLREKLFGSGADRH